MTKNRAVSIILTILMLALVLSACGGGATAVPTPVVFPGAPGPTGAALDNPSGQYAPTISVPADDHLSGSLYFSDYELGIAKLDFTASQITRIFRPPANAMVNAVALSPDGRTLLMTYSPPPDPSNPHYSSTSVLYTLPANGSGQPALAMGNSGSADYDFSPWWSPDGKYIYYGRYLTPVVNSTPVAGPVGYFLTRYALPNGPSQDIRPNVLAVRLSTDGKKMFYVSVDTNTTLRLFQRNKSTSITRRKWNNTDEPLAKRRGALKTAL